MNNHLDDESETINREAEQAIAIAAALKEIADRKRKFQAATPAGKRVLIAKDVLEQIKAKRFVPRSGTWVGSIAMNDMSAVSFRQRAADSPEESLQKLFLSNEIASCECCALGAMFMACTLNNNKTSLREVAPHSDYEDGGLGSDIGPAIQDNATFGNGLTRFFTRTQLSIIEQAFEGEDGFFNPENAGGSTSQLFHLNHAAQRFYKRYSHIGGIHGAQSEVTARLKGIMQNIIDNGGEFVP